MSYALASYALIAAGVLGYALQLARTRRRLVHELRERSQPNRG